MLLFISVLLFFESPSALQVLVSTCHNRFVQAFTFAAPALETVLFLTPIQAQVPRYHWTAGETTRFLIQRDPYFDDPKAAVETVTLDGDYKPPTVERLTEKVLSVSASGAATLRLTLTPEPGFEDDAQPQAALSRTVVVSASGKVISVLGPVLGSSPAEKDLLRGFPSVPPVWRMAKDNLVVDDCLEPLAATQSTSPDHDGTLLQTTQVSGAGHTVFDCHRGQLVRSVWTRTIILSLTMTKRGRRGSDDFGHVVPSSRVVQTLSIECRPNLP